jgi:hypothetical protein
VFEVQQVQQLEQLDFAERIRVLGEIKNRLYELFSITVLQHGVILHRGALGMWSAGCGGGVAGSMRAAATVFGFEHSTQMHDEHSTTMLLVVGAISTLVNCGLSAARLVLLCACTVSGMAGTERDGVASAPVR